MFLTIITINFNNAKGLRRTIESVVNQTSKDYEFIVIDGGSTDGSVEVLKDYSDRISFWVSEPDKGIYNAMNKGIFLAKGEYCNFMNSGDIFYADDVLESVASYDKKEDIVSGDIFYKGQGIWKNPDRLTMKLFYKHALYHQACFIKSSLLKTNPYDETLKIASDWKWFVEQLVFGGASYAHIPVTVTLYEGGGISESNATLGRKECDKVWRQLLPSTILDDYEDFVYGNTPYRRMFTIVEEIPPFKKILYRIDVLILKLLNFKFNSKWIKELPWSCN